MNYDFKQLYLVKLVVPKLDEVVDLVTHVVVDTHKLVILLAAPKVASVHPEVVDLVDVAMDKFVAAVLVAAVVHNAVNDARHKHLTQVTTESTQFSGTQKLGVIQVAVVVLKLLFVTSLPFYIIIFIGYVSFYKIEIKTILNFRIIK